MYIIINKQNYQIIDRIYDYNPEIIDNTWVKSSHGSLLQLDMVDVFQVESIPLNVNYYHNNKFTSYDPILYQQTIDQYISRVKELVRINYPDADTEIAILRKYTAGIDTKGEFNKYNTYVEQCKLQAKTELGLI